jgi:predicted secreted protein
MSKAFSASMAAALLAGMNGTAIAQAAPAAQAPAQASTPDPNEVICERQEVLGSRLAKRKVCHTRAEWADLKLQDRQDLERAQTRRGMKGE